jgi:hypothetical protein
MNARRVGEGGENRIEIVLDREDKAGGELACR